MAIVVKCTCGKQYQVKDEYAGKRIKCACGQVMTVPVPKSAGKASPPATPPKKSAAPIKSSGQKKDPQSSKRLLLIGAGAGVVVLGLALWLVFFRGTETKEQNKTESQPVATGPTEQPENKEPKKTQEPDPPVTKEPEKSPTAKPDPKSSSQPGPQTKPETKPKGDPPSDAKEVHWQASERLLLDAAEVKKAQHGRVWISSDGKRTAYILQQGKQECLVVDGKPGKLYDSVRVCNFRRDGIFFGADQHYAFVARQDKLSCFVVDGQEDQWYTLIEGNAFLSPTDKTWMYVTWPKAKEKQGWVVVNGKETYPIGTFPIFKKSVLFAGGHALWWDFEESKYWAVYDGKKEKEYGFIDEKSLILHPGGAYAYSACHKIGEGDYFVVNGKESPKYVNLFERSITFSPDGKHYAFWASRGKEGGGVVVVDGKEHPVPSLAFHLKFSLDGKHWACSVSSQKSGSVLLDGKVVGSGYDEYMGLLDDMIAFSPDGTRFAYAARKDKKAFVVLDGKEHPTYHNIRNLKFSIDGRRLAYLAKRTEKGKFLVVEDGKEGKEYDRIEGGTINYGTDGRNLSYVVLLGKENVAQVGEKGNPGFLVIDGQERTRYDKILPWPNRTLYMGEGKLSYVAVRDGAYYWVEEIRVAK